MLFFLAKSIIIIIISPQALISKKTFRAVRLDMAGERLGKQIE